MASLKSKFISTVAGTALSVAGALGMSGAAYADDASNVAGRPATDAQQELSMLDRAPSDETPVMSRKDAFLASEDQIVLHYGEGIRDVEILADILRKEGYPVLSVAGGKPNEVSLFVGHGIYGPYNQRDIYDGELGLHASNRYEERIGPVLDQPVASLD